VDNSISKIGEAEDGRLNIYPINSSPDFQYIYREAAGVHWNENLKCFQSSQPNNWDKWGHREWYNQILSVVRTGLGERLRLVDTTVFEENILSHKKTIMKADTEVQKWLDEN